MRDLINKSIRQVSTNEIGLLKSVDGNKATVLIEEQVYPNYHLLELFEQEEKLLIGLTEQVKENACVPFKWADKVGSNVLVCFLNQNRSQGVVVGVVL